MRMAAMPEKRLPPRTRPTPGNRVPMIVQPSALENEWDGSSTGASTTGSGEWRGRVRVGSPGGAPGSPRRGAASVKGAGSVKGDGSMGGAGLYRGVGESATGAATGCGAETYKGVGENRVGASSSTGADWYRGVVALGSGGCSRKVGT
jgi:hypothetical protein